MSYLLHYSDSTFCYEHRYINIDKKCYFTSQHILKVRTILIRYLNLMVLKQQFDCKLLLMTRGRLQDLQFILRFIVKIHKMVMISIRFFFTLLNINRKLVKGLYTNTCTLHNNQVVEQIALLCNWSQGPVCHLGRQSY